MAAWSIRLSPGAQRTGYAGPATRGMGPHSGRMPMSITRSRESTSHRIVGESLAKRGASTAFMRSLRHLEQEPGASRPPDRRRQRPVTDGEVDEGEREAAHNRQGELRGEPVVGPVAIEEVGERDGGRAGGHGFR